MDSHLQYIFTLVWWLIMTTSFSVLSLLVIIIVSIIRCNVCVYVDDSYSSLGNRLVNISMCPASCVAPPRVSCDCITECHGDVNIVVNCSFGMSVVLLVFCVFLLCVLHKKRQQIHAARHTPVVPVDRKVHLASIIPDGGLISCDSGFG